MGLLIDKAKVHHVAAAAIKYQCHVGRLIDYTRMAAEEGMVSLMMCDGAWGPKFVAPWGGKERRLGVNPWSIAIPSDQGWMGFDMTSASVSITKLMRAVEYGEAVPGEWVIDRDGRPTSNPQDFFDGGSAAPIGGTSLGYKGYVLTFMIEVLADVLSGMEFAEDPSRPWPIVDGCFMAVFNVGAFRPLADFKQDLARMTEYVKSSATAEGALGVFYPGERSHLMAEKRAIEGVAIPGHIWESIVNYAQEFEVEALLPAPI
jgi:uncharacterized oxidoreductase